MDFSWNEEERAFRERIQQFLQQYWDATAGERKMGDARRFEKQLAEHGWLTMAWPSEYGGRDATHIEQMIFREEATLHDAPTGGMGPSMIGPCIIVHGTEEQKQQHLPAIAAGESRWCQGFSEPGAGSDLASLQTRAVRDGDEFVVNGQKIWTSNAHRANWIFALVRTNPDAPKHRGISFMLMDMETPGIEVRPLVSGAWQHFSNETFYEDVRVPVDQVVGEIDRGWYVGMTLLDYERSNISGAVSSRRELESVFDYAKTDEGAAKSRSLGQGTVRAELADRYIESEVGFNFSFRIISMQAAGVIPNYEASTSKMFASELGQRIARTGTKMFGLYSNLWDPDDEHTPYGARFTQNYFHLIPSTIAGGSSEIQRNIIATRGLGLPRG